MTEPELLEAIRARIADPRRRIDVTTVRTPPIYPVAAPAALANAEAELGFGLPPLLKRLYSEVANGGFGPGDGMLGIQGGHLDVDGRTLTARYAYFRPYGWPVALLPLWDWGGGAWSCVDALSTDEHVFTMDDTGPTRTRFSLLLWLESWVAGVDLWHEIYETTEGTTINPFTRQPMTIKRRGRAKGAS